MGFLDSLFGGNSTKDDKRISLRDIGGVRKRNEADINAFGTQQRLDTLKNVGEQNAQAAQFVRNQGLAGSTIAPTLMAGNSRRGNDALARLGEMIRMQRMNIRNSALNQRLPIQMTPVVDQGWLSRINALVGTAQNVAGPIAGALGGFGGEGGGGFSGQQWAGMGGMNQVPGQVPSNINMYDWASPKRSGYFNSRSVEA